MANWSKKDYYQGSESEDEEEIAIEKLKERTALLQESDFLPSFEQEALNFNQLSEDELLELIERDSPELLGILELLQPLHKAFKSSTRTQDETALAYCKLLSAHIAFYIHLKSRGKLAANHPVVSGIKLLEKRIKSSLPESATPHVSEEAFDAHNDIDETNANQTKVHREVDEKIKKNKGIVKKRKKIERNVRVKNKMKYLKKVQKRRGTLGYKEGGQKDHYEGETTGIRKNLVKSTKLS